MLQFTDNDETSVVPDKLPDGFLLSDADYNSSFDDKPAAHAVDPITTTTTPTKPATTDPTTNPTTNPVPKV